MVWTSPPLFPPPTSPHQAFAPLQRNVEGDDCNGSNAAMGPMYRGQGRQLGGQAMQSTIAGDDAIVVVGCGGRDGGRRTIKTSNYKRWRVRPVIRRVDVV